MENILTVIYPVWQKLEINTDCFFKNVNIDLAIIKKNSVSQDHYEIKNRHDKERLVLLEKTSMA